MLSSDEESEDEDPDSLPSIEKLLAKPYKRHSMVKLGEETPLGCLYAG